MTSCCTNWKPMLSCASFASEVCPKLHISALAPVSHEREKKKIQRDTFVLKREHCCVNK